MGSHVYVLVGVESKIGLYLKEQNVKLDMERFREYLKEAYMKAKKFMDNEG
jgi:protein O-GlcNAc transferase